MKLPDRSVCVSPLMKAFRARAGVEPAEMLSQSSFPDIFTRSVNKPAPNKWDEPQAVTAAGFTWTSIKLQTVGLSEQSAIRDTAEVMDGQPEVEKKEEKFGGFYFTACYFSCGDLVGSYSWFLMAAMLQFVVAQEVQHEDH